MAAGKGDFVAQHIPGLFAQLHKGRGVAYLGGARTRQRYVQNGFDATGSVRHDGDAIRQIDGFIEAVGDEDDGGLVLLPDAQQLGLQNFACLGIQGGKRFVHQQQTGRIGQGAGDGHALTHPAREFVRVALAEAGQAHQVQKLLGSLPALAFGNLADLQPDLDVLKHGTPRKQRIALEHHALLAVDAAGRLAVDADAAAALACQPGQHIEKRGLAAARGPEEGEELAFTDIEIEVLQGGDLLLAAALVGNGEIHAHIACPDLDGGAGVVEGRAHVAAPLAKGLNSLVYTSLTATLPGCSLPSRSSTSM